MGAEVFVSDAAKITAETARSLESAGIRHEEGGHTEKIFDCDKVVLGSGFPSNAPVLDKLASRGINPVGELDFVLPFVKGRVIGVTGSNGKTTTATILGHLLSAEGVNCAVAGNIGNPAADVTGIDYDYIVLELSSFQLHWAEHVKFAGAIVTNLAPDHIDWHGSYENYLRAKAKLVGFVEHGGFTIVQKRDREMFETGGVSAKYLTWDLPHADDDIFLSLEKASAVMEGKELFRFGETRLLGTHNMENIAMAMGMVDMLGFGAAARAALPSCAAPPHRCSLVLEKD
jgi:UDP-N-acetylmuramoylalanine--D-glutamate ligase